MPQAFSVIAGVMGPRVVEISVEEHAAATVKCPEAANTDHYLHRAVSIMISSKLTADSSDRVFTFFS